MTLKMRIALQNEVIKKMIDRCNRLHGEVRHLMVSRDLRQAEIVQLQSEIWEMKRKEERRVKMAKKRKRKK